MSMIWAFVHDVVVKLCPDIHACCVGLNCAVKRVLILAVAVEGTNVCSLFDVRRATVISCGRPCVALSVVVRYKSSWPPPKRSISEFSCTCTYNADRMPTKTGRLLWHVRNRIEASGCAVFGMGQSGASTNGRTATVRRLVAVDCDCFCACRASSGR